MTLFTKTIGTLVLEYILAHAGFLPSTVGSTRVYLSFI